MVSVTTAGASPKCAAKKNAGTKASRAAAHTNIGTGAVTVAAGTTTGVILPMKSPQLYRRIKITGYLRAGKRHGPVRTETRMFCRTL
jgi:hypothetical protein